jgi:hypothetical protein
VVGVLLYRDTLALNNITFAVCRADAGGQDVVRIDAPVALDTMWTYKAFVTPPV